MFWTKSAGDMIPNRRITADSFRLLTARLKKKPTAVAQTEFLPEPAILAPLEIVEETVISAPVAEIERRTTIPQEDIEFAWPEVTEKKPWAWLTPADPVKPQLPDPLSETETPVQAVEEAKPAPEPEPWRELPFEELFAAPAITEPEPEIASAEPEAILAEPEPAWVEPEMLRLNPKQFCQSQNWQSVEPEIVALEPAVILQSQNWQWPNLNWCLNPNVLRTDC